MPDQPAETGRVAFASDPVQYEPGLTTEVRLRIPPEARSVGDLTEYLLESTGYQLVLYCRGCPDEAPRIAADPISPIAYVAQGRTMRAERAIKLALGLKSRLVVDPELRSLSFEFLPSPDVRAERIVRVGDFAAHEVVVGSAAEEAVEAMRRREALAAIERRVAQRDAAEVASATPTADQPEEPEERRRGGLR